ncbi:MAG TPA: HAD-IA family hydrolase [Actinomycetota bacterium]|nr:HAD-IA family hydrolase [Actinomycetota bacterium]
MDAALLDLYDTVVRTRWGELSTRITGELEIDRSDLYRAYDETRAARSVGAFDGPEGDMAAIVEAAGVAPSPELIERLVSLERAFAETGIEVWEDSIPVVSELRARGVRTALISNCSHSTRGVVDRLRLDEAFDEIVLSVEVGLRKPDPAIYRLALERLGADPDRAVFVDDQPAYCDGAAALGIGTFLIDRSGDATPDEDGHRVISDLRALLG